jgi:hypothetical protein
MKYIMATILKTNLLADLMYSRALSILSKYRDPQLYIKRDSSFMWDVYIGEEEDYFCEPLALLPEEMHCCDTLKREIYRVTSVIAERTKSSPEN